MKYMTVFLKRNRRWFSMGLFTTCLCAVCRRMGAAMPGLSRLSLAVRHWVVPCFLTCLFFVKLEGGSFSPVFKAVVSAVSLVRKHVNWGPVIRCWSTRPKKERKKERKKKPVCLLQLCTESELFSLLFCVLLAFPMSEDVWCYFLQALKWNGLVCWRFVLYQLRTLVLDTSEYWLNLFLLLPVRFSHLPLLWGFMLFFCFCFSNS